MTKTNVDLSRVATVGAAPDLIELGELPVITRSPLQLFWKRFREDKLALGALVFLVLLILVAIFAKQVIQLVGAPPPDVQDTSALDLFGTATGPSSAHPFGVDQIGRDVFSRTVYGAQVSLIVAFVATALATIAGVIAGLLAGYFRGWVDTLVSRSVDVLLAIPYLLLATGLAAACTLGGGCLGGHVDLRGIVLLACGGAALIVAVVLGRRRGWDHPGRACRSSPACFCFARVPIPLPTIQLSARWSIFVIAFTSWTYMARIIRGQTLSLREKEFVEAARSVGASDRRIIFREILPNLLVAPIIVYASMLLPQVILYEAALSFLGVGVQPPRASWGQMIADATPRISAPPGGT